jgi:hypothetical protein
MVLEIKPLRLYLPKLVDVDRGELHYPYVYNAQKFGKGSGKNLQSQVFPLPIPYFLWNVYVSKQRRHIGRWSIWRIF